MQNQTISELYIDDQKSKYSNNPSEILKSAKSFYKNLYTRDKGSKSATDELLNKIPPNRKISKEHFKLCEAEISLDEIIKAINSKKNNKSPGNDGLTAEVYKQFLNELAPILLEVYNSGNNLALLALHLGQVLYLLYIKRVIRKT